MKTKRSLDTVSAALFLAPNFIGFAVFTLTPLLLCLAMVFTNWSLVPAVSLKFIGLRNFSDLLGFRATGEEHGALLGAYIVAGLTLLGGTVGMAWAALARFKGLHLGAGVLISGAVAALFLNSGAGSQGVAIAAVAAILTSLVFLAREEKDGAGSRVPEG